jgi:hypothetical protein
MEIYEIFQQNQFSSLCCAVHFAGVFFTGAGRGHCCHPAYGLEQLEPLPQ